MFAHFVSQCLDYNTTTEPTGSGVQQSRFVLGFGATVELANISDPPVVHTHFHHIRLRSASGNSLDDPGALRKPGYVRAGALLPRCVPGLEQRPCETSKALAAMERN